MRSGEHCKICSSSDEDRDVYLYDLSCNGTYVNGKLVGKDSRQLLKGGDTVTLLDPAKPQPPHAVRRRGAAARRVAGSPPHDPAQPGLR